MATPYDFVESDAKHTNKLLTDMLIKKLNDKPLLVYSFPIVKASLKDRLIYKFTFGRYGSLTYFVWPEVKEGETITIRRPTYYN